MNVYIIKCQNTNFYKIGVSDNIEGRLKNLQTANPRELILVSGFICKEPFKLERIIHNEYEDKRKKGEWFEIYDISKLEEFMRNQVFEMNNTYYTCHHCEFRTIYKKILKCHKKKCRECIEIDTIEMVYEEIDTTEIDTTEMVYKRNPFECPDCHQIFTRLYNLERHVNKKNKCKKVEKIQEKEEEIVVEELKKFKCPYCNKLYTRNYDVTRHLKTCKSKKKAQKDEEIQRENEEIKMRKEKLNLLIIYYNTLLKKTGVRNEEIKQEIKQVEETIEVEKIILRRIFTARLEQLQRK